MFFDVCVELLESFCCQASEEGAGHGGGVSDCILISFCGRQVSFSGGQIPFSGMHLPLPNPNNKG